MGSRTGFVEIMTRQTHWSRFFDRFQTIYGRDPLEQFGSSLFVIDLDQDGADDLIVGSPFWTGQNCPECGRISIYLQNLDNSVLTFSHSIEGIRKSARFGFSITGHDADRDGFPEIFVSGPAGKISKIYEIPGSKTARCPDVQARDQT